MSNCYFLSVKINPSDEMFTRVCNLILGDRYFADYKHSLQLTRNLPTQTNSGKNSFATGNLQRVAKLYFSAQSAKKKNLLESKFRNQKFENLQIAEIILDENKAGE